MALSGKQKSVVFGALAGVAGVVAIVAASLMISVPMLEAASIDDRLSLLTACLASPAICLFVAIGRLANHRFSSADDIDAAVGGEPSRKARIYSAILQNTSEQTLLAAMLYTIAALQLPAAFTDAISYAAISFLVGRILFAVGYEGGAGRRAAGFALTFYPNVALGLMIAATALF